MKKFWKIFIVAVLLVATFVTTLIFGNTINNWFDKTFVSKDSKVIGEWYIDNIKISEEKESFEINKEDYEKFILKFDVTKATDLEKYFVKNYDFNGNFNFNNDGTVEMYLINESGEKEIVESCTWTFKKGTIKLIFEDKSTLDFSYKNKSIIREDFNGEKTITTTYKRVEIEEDDSKEEFSVIGEWNVSETRLETNADSFTLKAEDYEEFKANYDESTASELETQMYEICDGMFLQKYVITEDKFEIHVFNGEEFECFGEFDYKINEDGNLEYSFDAEEDNMIVLIKDGQLINQQGSLEEMRLSQIFSKNN